MSEVKETLSSNTLFHFTNERRWLENIIGNGLIPRLSLENLSMYDIHTLEESIAIPMVCFCDIPLSKAKYHISIYGNFGIGLSKNWCIEQGVSPLMYLNPNSKTTLAIKESLFFLGKFFDEKKLDITDYQLINQGLMALIRYSKIYEGDFMHRGVMHEKKRFYDEREWRYIPTIVFPDDSNEYGINPWYLINKEKDFDLIKLDFVEKISSSQKFTIELNPKKINYIIVGKDEDVDYIQKVLEYKFENSLTAAEMRRLMSKILTKEQIEQDF